jgi:hypothetical protein
MVWIVVTINLVLSLGLIWSARQIWQLRAALASASDSIDGWAKASQRGLSGSPPAILVAQKGAGSLKEQYWAFLPQIQRIQMILFTLERVQSLIRGMHMKPKTRQKGKGQPNKFGRSNLHVQRRR